MKFRNLAAMRCCAMLKKQKQKKTSCIQVLMLLFQKFSPLNYLWLDGLTPGSVRACDLWNNFLMSTCWNASQFWFKPQETSPTLPIYASCIISCLKQTCTRSDCFLRGGFFLCFLNSGCVDLTSSSVVDMSWSKFLGLQLVGIRYLTQSKPTSSI